MSTYNPELKGILYAALTYFLFSVNDVMVKFAAEQSLSVHQILASQSVIGLFLVGILVLFRGGAHHLYVNSIWVLLARAIAAGCGTVLAYYGFSRLPLTDVYAIIFCTPLLVTIFSALLLKETVKIYRYSAVIVGFIGILIIINPATTTVTLVHLITLGCALFGAANVIIMRRFGRSEQPVMILLAALVGYAVVSIPFTLTSFVWPSHFEWTLLIASSTLIVGGQFCLLRALTVAQASVIAPLQYTQMIWAIIFGLIFFNDYLKLSVTMGTLLIIGASLYTFHRERVHGRTLQAQIKR